MHDLRRRRNPERIDEHTLAIQHAGELHEVAGFAAGARADVGAIKFDIAQLFGQFALTWIGMAGDGRLEF